MGRGERSGRRIGEGEGREKMKEAAAKRKKRRERSDRGGRGRRNKVVVISEFKTCCSVFVH